MKQLLFFCFILTFLCFAQADTCTTIKDNQTCVTSNQDGVACVWCISHAVPSTCVTADQAKKLPPSIFSCSTPPSTPPSVHRVHRHSLPISKPIDTTCTTIKDNETCVTSSQSGVPCVWCISHAVPSTCVTADQAKKLPPSIFSCSTPPSVHRVGATDCLDIKDPTICRQSNDGNSSCVWCVSQAVPSSCVDQQQAAKLPPSVFNCSASASVRSAALINRMRSVSKYAAYRAGRAPVEQLFIGIAEGLIEGVLPDFGRCIVDSERSFVNFYDFSRHLHLDLSDVKQAIKDLGDGLKSFDSAMSDCHIPAISEKVAEFVGKVTSVVGDIVVATEIVVNGIDIYEDLHSAVVAWEDGNYLQCGFKLADAIAIVI